MGYLDNAGLARLWEKVKAAAIPAGGIIVWSGAANAVPEGWVLCDGQNGAPDLRGQFVLGAGGTYSVGDTGGEETHRLTLDEMPQHAHKVGQYAGGSVSKMSVYGSGNPASGSILTGSTENAGGTQDHNNMPPYYALCYIMRRG